jgi:hypothetical protein
MLGRNPITPIVISFIAFIIEELCYPINEKDSK